MNSQLLRRIKSFGGPSATRASLRVLGCVFCHISGQYLYAAVSIDFASGKPICEPFITLVASHLPTFCGLPLANCAGFA